MLKPVTPIHQGINDYIFAGIQIAVPTAFSVNEKAKNIYAINGATFGLMNALTDKPVGASGVLSFKTHQKADAAFLATLMLLSLQLWPLYVLRVLYQKIKRLQVFILVFLLQQLLTMYLKIIMAIQIKA